MTDCDEIKQYVYGGALHVPANKTKEEVLTILRSADLDGCSTRVKQWAEKVVKSG